MHVEQDLNQSITRHILQQVQNMAPKELQGVQIWQQSAESFSGSFVLNAPRPSGGLLVLLGDFTGRGLPAAMGMYPMAEVFYGMAEKGFGLGDIVAEIHKKLCVLLPDSLFCAAIMVELDKDANMLAVWNGGLPDVLVTDRQRRIKAQVASQHFPLGVAQQPAGQDNQDTVFIDLSAGDKVYLATRDLHKLAESDGRKFADWLAERVDFTVLTAGLAEQASHQTMSTDSVLVELDIDSIRSMVMSDERVQQQATIPPADWQAEFSLSAEILKYMDIAPFLTQVVMSIQAPVQHKQCIYTILAEMCSNALDHGILELDSALKQHAHGFAEYYALRKQRLAQLIDAHLQISLTHRKTEAGGVLTICVEDSGKGFDFRQYEQDLADNTGYCGRGMPLMRQLCQQFFFSGKGNKATAIYQWS